MPTTKEMINFLEELYSELGELLGYEDEEDDEEEEREEGEED